MAATARSLATNQNVENSTTPSLDRLQSTTASVTYADQCVQSICCLTQAHGMPRCMLPTLLDAGLQLDL